MMRFPIIIYKTDDKRIAFKVKTDPADEDGMKEV
jgi:hypothetical protein